MNYIYVISIVIVIIIILFFLFYKKHSLKDVNGLWMADEEFCQESGVELMTIYFGDYPDKRSEKLCWILILNGKGTYNHITTAELTECNKISKDQYEYQLELGDVPDNIFSTNLILKIAPGLLITIIEMESDKKIFEGSLNKEVSDLINFEIN
jgi:hypothetical protein